MADFYHLMVGSTVPSSGGMMLQGRPPAYYSTIIGSPVDSSIHASPSPSLSLLRSVAS
jgi:hypothetical protein